MRFKDQAPPSAGVSPPDPAARRLAAVAFLAAITALLLPWWSVTHTTGGLLAREEVAAFRPEPPLTTTWGPWLSGILVGVAALLLFVRIAGRSDLYEPRVWRRDLLAGAFLLGAAAVSALTWPADVPAFWGGRTLHNATITDGANTTVEVALPGLGWWLVLLAALLLALAWRLARTAPPTTTK